MTHQDRDPPGRRMAPVESRRRADTSSQQVGSRQALWSCAVAVAVVFVLGIVFYQINAKDHPQTATTATKSVTSTNNTPRTNNPQTTGQGGSQK